MGARLALREVVEHLVQHHNRRKIVFIQGAAGNPDSIERECVVRTVLNELNVPLSDQFVLPGDFLESSGATAIRMLFNQRGAPLDSIDAVIASNDQMAVGAMHELTQRGLRIPRDVSVIGFDDDDFARSANPPLTTVSQPIEMIGERALATILMRVQGGTVPERTVLDATPVWRRSCGCSSPRTMRGKSADPAQSLHSAIDQCRGVCFERYQCLVGNKANSHAIDAVIRLFQLENDDDLDPQLLEIENHIVEASKSGLDPLYWHDLLLPLSDELERRTTQEGTVGRRMERQMRLLSLLINEVAARIRALDQLHTMQWANNARVFANALLCVRHVRSLASVLKEGLPSLGIQYCCVCLFVGDTEPRTARVAALYNPTVPPPVESPRSAEQLWLAVPASTPPDPLQQTFDGSVFPAFELVHPQLRLSPADALNLSVYPLVHAHATLGYVVFDAPSDGTKSWLLEGLAGSLSSAVYAIERSAELLRAREVAERANAAKTEFVAIISHEVRTPLTAIMGHINLCLQTKLLADQSHHLVQARNSSRTLLGIVNDILDFSRIEAQKLVLEAVPFALDDVLDQVVATCASTVNRKGLHLIVDVNVTVPKWLKGDPLRLTQVLLNLVGNAIKFSSHGDVRVAVERATSKEPGDVLLGFSVQDEGIGMSPDDIARVFEPFAQGDGSMTRRYGGTGLGLTISRRLIALMDGELTVTSKPGKGSRFVFDALFKPQNTIAASPSYGSGKSVLVVENHLLLGQAIERLLKSHGFQVTSVVTAEAAAESLTQAKGQRPGFDLMICDYELPDIIGGHLLRRAVTEMQLSGPNTVLLCPSDVNPGPMENSELPNLIAVIRKPFQRGHLLQAMMTALAKSSGQGPVSKPNLLHSGVLPPGTRILVVQDDATSREVVREMLIHAGAEVSVAACGEEGIDLVAHQSFELVFQDLHLPGIDGFETAQAIRSLPQGSRVPIVALSASPMRNCLERCLTAGINDYLVTPVNGDTLIRTARLWIGGEAMAPPLSQRFNSVTYSGEPQRQVRALSTPTAGAELDVERALGQLAGDTQTYLALLGRFARSHDHTTREIRETIEQGNLSSAILTVHSLSSAAANIGATWLHEAARMVEATLRDEDVTCYSERLTDLELAESRTMGAIEGILRAQVMGDCPTLEPEIGNIGEILKQLRALIDEHDTAVFDQLARLKSILGAKRAASDAFHKLESSISAYDFDQAREHFEAVASWISHCDKLFCSMN